MGTQPFSPIKRIFSCEELLAAGVSKDINNYEKLVNSLNLIENPYFTAQNALNDQLPVSTAYQLTSSLKGIQSVSPIVHKKTVENYFAKATVAVSQSPTSRAPGDTILVQDIITNGLTELCRAKPAGLDAIEWLGEWFLNHNPTQPIAHKD